MEDTDQKYINILMQPLESCLAYTPKFGAAEGEGVSLEGFKTLYGSDPFYHWVGLDDDLMYAAHKAAGGMTSVYRQLGRGCEQLFRAVLKDSLGLSDEAVSWAYVIKRRDKSNRVLTLDARIDLDHLENHHVARQKIRDWLDSCANSLNYSNKKIAELQGVVFEVRQGYKSADAKRQNADLQFATNALSANYLPVLAVMSDQTSESVIRRYRNAKMLVITGKRSDDDTSSTFAFFANVLGYSLVDLFERNEARMRDKCRTILKGLLSPS